MYAQETIQAENCQYSISYGKVARGYFLGSATHCNQYDNFANLITNV